MDALVQYLEMRLGRLHCEAVDRQQILRASGECDNAIHLGTQCHMAARCADRGPHFDPIAVDDRDVHEQVQWRRRFRRREPECRQPGREIVGAVIVILGAAERLVAPAVAGGEQGVVDPARGVLDQGQDRPSPVGDERVADRRE